MFGKFFGNKSQDDRHQFQIELNKIKQQHQAELQQLNLANQQLDRKSVV